MLMLLGIGACRAVPPAPVPAAREPERCGQAAIIQSKAAAKYDFSFFPGCLIPPEDVAKLMGWKQATVSLGRVTDFVCYTYHRGTGGDGHSENLSIEVKWANALLNDEEYRQFMKDVEGTSSGMEIGEKEKLRKMMMPDVGRRAICGVTARPPYAGVFIVVNSSDARFDFGVYHDQWNDDGLIDLARRVDAALRGRSN
ncbi:MAG: hypothetical protein V1809_11825 [Planctomycetota bacterium]